jgi:hypothetical protein
VDSTGGTASVEIAMSALDSYDRINHERKLGFASFGLALLLGVSVIVTRERPKTDVA